jgi:Spy/CpxP family protein refolding chaperone
VSPVVSARRLAVMSLALAASLGGTVYAQMPEAPPGKWWKRPRIVQLLNLSAEQQTKLEDIFSRRRREFVDLKADVDRHQIDVEELVAKKDSDPKRVSTAVDALEQARVKLRKAATMMFLEQKDVLTAPQWQLVLERREEWHRLRQERRNSEGAPNRAPGGSSPSTGRERPQRRPADQPAADAPTPPDR